MKQNFRKTMNACFVGYIVQAIVNNFVPLLFVTFQKSYEIPLSRITLLITFNFVVQLLVDCLSAGFVDRIGYRISILLAHILSAAGLILLTILPEVTRDPFYGILIPVTVYAIGGGLIEVLISPIMDACPTENKEAAMSLLHSFYCWGHVGVVLVSTVFFALFGIRNWKILAIAWSVIPVYNTLVFLKTPMPTMGIQGETGLRLMDLFQMKAFWLMMLMMMCAGASEQAVSQWASTFAEEGLGVSKALGDLAGPMAFALLMGVSRLLYGKLGHKLNLDSCMAASCGLCVASYLVISLIPLPVLGLAGCGLCGFSVGILWPGTFSKASATIHGGGTALFAMLALAGDVGCAAGPTIAGFVSSAAGNNLRAGILGAIGFPVLLLLGVTLSRKKKIHA